MKKIVLALLLIANSLFAITLAEIDLQTYTRAMITQAEVRDANEYATKINSVNYPYWNSGDPYLNLKYTGEVNSWYYTFDFTNYYTYSTYWDSYINQANLSVTYIYLDLKGYNINDVQLFKYQSGVKTLVPTSSIVASSGDIKLFKIENSTTVSSFSVETFIQATDGTAILGNTVTINRTAL